MCMLVSFHSVCDAFCIWIVYEGTIPSELGGLCELNVLYLYQNSFNGTYNIPNL